MKIAKSALQIVFSRAEYIFIALIAFYIIGVLYIIIKTKPIKWQELKPRNFLNGLTKSKLLQGIIVSILAFGFISTVCSLVFSNTQIGAFFEKENYTETYASTLYLRDKPVFCIVLMHHNTETDGGRTRSFYWLDRIDLPYGKYEELDELYDPDDTNFIYLGEDITKCRIVLNHPTNESSANLLNNTLVSNYGLCCANIQSDIFHYIDCPIVESIKKSDLIYFEDEIEAKVFGFEMCGECCNAHI